jgi:hypothetical protein
METAAHGGPVSVLPHGDAVPVDLPGRIRSVEEFYAGHGMRARFQISPGACPDGLDDALAERGYRVDSPMSLQSAPTAHVIDRLPAGELRIRMDDQPTDAWFVTWLAVHGTGGDPGPERDMLRRVDRPSGYASVLTGAGVIAVGRAVTETGWAGAAHMYLQVEYDNTAARRLSERAGFTELCRYHYRTGGCISGRASRRNKGSPSATAGTGPLTEITKADLFQRAVSGPRRSCGSPR